MKIALTQFAGMAPRVAPRLLPDNFAQEANEVKLWSGELRPFYEDTRRHKVYLYMDDK